MDITHGAYAPNKLDADAWNEIVCALGRPLHDDEDVVIREKYTNDIADRYFEAGFSISLLFGGIRGVDDRSLQVVARPEMVAGASWRVLVSAMLFGRKDEVEAGTYDEVKISAENVEADDAE